MRFKLDLKERKSHLTYKLQEKQKVLFYLAGCASFTSYIRNKEDRLFTMKALTQHYKEVNEAEDPPTVIAAVVKEVNKALAEDLKRCIR